MTLVKTEDGYALTVAGRQVYEVYVPDWDALGERAVVLPCGPFAVVIEWQQRSESWHDPWNWRIDLTMAVRDWSYQIGLHSRKTRLYRDVPPWREDAA